MIEAPRERDTFIDTWRAIAILAVAYWHYVDRLPPEAFQFRDGVSVPMQFGYLGVEVFFVISAFLVAPAAARAPSLAGFLARRIARIWPLFAVAACVVFAVGQFFPAPLVSEGPKSFDVSGRTLADLFGTIFLLKDLGFRWVDGAYWSILVEIKFYFLLALLLAAFGKHFATALGLLSVILASAYLLFATPGLVEFEAGRRMASFAIGPYLPFFAIGAFWGRGERPPLLTANIVLAVALLALDLSQEEPVHALDTVRFIVVLAGVVLLDWLLLRQRIMLWIGRYSYAIYLFHQVLGLTILVSLSSYLTADVAVLVTFAGICALAWVASQLAEYRFQPAMIRLLTPVLARGPFARPGYAHVPQPPAAETQAAEHVPVGQPRPAAEA